jgi:4-hydroxybenzoate polyprenyltransferase
MALMNVRLDHDEHMTAVAAQHHVWVRVRDLVRLARPEQWAKNSFVLVPLLFGEVLTHPGAILSGLVACFCFCLWSSAVYCFNDILDAETDAKHPRKKERPVASGRVSVLAAAALCAGLLAGGMVLGLFFVNLPFLMAAGVYLANSVLYCLLLKYRVIVDVVSIAVGFVLRIVAGCLAIAVVPTPWILVCGFALAMLLGFGKRRLEIGALAQPTEYRASLESYSAEKLNILLSVSASLCLISYMLYTIAPETGQLHGTRNLVYSVPFVAYGVFRYLFKVQEARHDGPVEVLLTDPIFAVNGLLWVLAVFAILYVIK